MQLPKGFRASGVKAGIKPSGNPDLALVVSDAPCAWAFSGTQNLAAAASIRRARGLYASGETLRAVIVNAGNANCVTGEQGVQTDARMAELAALELRLEASAVLTASTGVIGVQLPVEKLEVGVPSACSALGVDLSPAATAIMTTDLVMKVAQVTLRGGARVVGFCKGSGMIHPNMATMLSFVVTDAVMDQSTLRAAFPGIVMRTFNAVTVDGDTSTNDMALVMANGAARETDAAEALEAIETVMRELAKKIARDGEGATKLLTVNVAGAPSELEAVTAARTVAGSSLFKSAVYGNDPNWGRILAALGRSGVVFEPTRASVRVQGIAVFDGKPLPFDKTAASSAMRSEEVVVDIDLGAGAARGTAWGCDLTEGYVRINAEYTT
ncbi:MAG: bifunctional glutamate N-acetyltransferase/amino-acid acetyltransferase ArgJ [Pleurocapsa sp. SU_196_0]|nr:bifunctional glutamate N-acetyltransferase/amino-acid acetyltransferase ArgJ [Pleurocapsa sp. SU_196_0]